jgi:hypothetical protein
MGCVSLANFVVLINGYPSNFLKNLKKGFLLSPFMFLLIVEGLSRLIHVTKRRVPSKECL